MHACITIASTDRVSYRGGEGGYLSPPPRFQIKFILTCSNISATSLLWPQNPPEAISEGVIFF